MAKRVESKPYGEMNTHHSILELLDHGTEWGPSRS